MNLDVYITLYIKHVKVPKKNYFSIFLSVPLISETTGTI